MRSSVCSCLQITPSYALFLRSLNPLVVVVEESLAIPVVILNLGIELRGFFFFMLFEGEIDDGTGAASLCVFGCIRLF